MKLAFVCERQRALCRGSGLAVHTFALLLVCSAPALAGPQAVAAPSSDSRVGEPLLVEWQGSYWPAHVIGDPGDGRVRIRYDGYGAEWDETITGARIRHERRAHPAPAVGRILYVGWGGALWQARIMRVTDHGYAIHYVGWGDEWDEVVGPERLHWLDGVRNGP